MAQYQVEATEKQAKARWYGEPDGQAHQALLATDYNVSQTSAGGACDVLYIAQVVGAGVLVTPVVDKCDLPVSVAIDMVRALYANRFAVNRLSFDFTKSPESQLKVTYG